MERVNEVLSQGHATRHEFRSVALRWIVLGACIGAMAWAAMTWGGLDWFSAPFMTH